MAGDGGNDRGLFCVFFLLILVAMLAVASFVVQFFAWRMIVDDDGREKADGPPGMRREEPGRPGEGVEWDKIREISETLAKFQPDNGRGPPIKEMLEYSRGDHGNKDDRVWSFAMEWEGNKLGYYDLATGRYGGYHVDMVNAVCQAAGKNCRIVAQDKSCWETSADYGARGGPALHRRWYDGCVGLSPSFTRSLVFDFTDSISPPPDSNFYTLPGNPGNFNWQDLRGKNIGFLSRWYTDHLCLIRNADIITQGSNLAVQQIHYYDSTQELLSAIQRSEVDAGFFTTESTDIASQLEPVGDIIPKCAIDGDAVMIRKDSKLEDWWNPAMQAVFNSYEYREICKDLDGYYSGWAGSSSEVICRSDFIN